MSNSFKLSFASSSVLSILDASSSMWEQIDGTTKISSAGKVSSSLVKDLLAEMRASFMVYSHRHKDDCKDVELLVLIESLKSERLFEKFQVVQPRGKLPLAYSLDILNAFLFFSRGSNQYCFRVV